MNQNHATGFRITESGCDGVRSWRGKRVERGSTGGGQSTTEEHQDKETLRAAQADPVAKDGNQLAEDM
ncbi:hypothetical protein SAMN05216308_11032 [Nitrosospira sp. Nsp13]|nr:hypothetical protein SAMN05216308_11032 [Nitrosospira sp. Nsp13]